MDLFKRKVLPCVLAVLTALSMLVVGVSANGIDRPVVYGGHEEGNIGPGGTDGSGNVAKGALNASCVGITMQIVRIPYKDMNSSEKVKEQITLLCEDPNSETILNGKYWNSDCTVYHNPWKSDSQVYQIGTLSGFRETDGNHGDAVPVPSNLNDFFLHVIYGQQFGGWDKNDVGSTDSLYANLLRFAGGTEEDVQIHINTYTDQYRIGEDDDVLIPMLIWSYVVIERNNHSVNTLMTPYEITGVANHRANENESRKEAAFNKWWYTSYADKTENRGSKIYQYNSGNSGSTPYGVIRSHSPATLPLVVWEYLEAFGGCGGKHRDTYACGNMLGQHWKTNGSPHSPNTRSDYPYKGSGMVNRIESHHNAGTYFFFRNFWSPYGERFVPEVQTQPFRLHKSVGGTPECVAQIQNNPMYTLAGAEYEVRLSDGTYQETLVTDADGNAVSSRRYPTGTPLLIRETKAPNGFKLDTTEYKFLIQAGDNVLEVEDIPVLDPPFAITKVDKVTGTPQGNGSFHGAIFKWEYYANNDWSGTPERTWYFQTDQNGKAHYKESYFATGYTSDALYVDKDGTPMVPIGTLKITEIKNSLGYAVVPIPLKCTVVLNADGTDAITKWAPESDAYIGDALEGNFHIYEPVDESLFGSLTLDKIDAITGHTPQGDGTLAGAKFEVINNSANAVQIEGFPKANPGEVCYTFTVDASGHFSSGNIFPLGDYIAREAVASNGYMTNSKWIGAFSITAENNSASFVDANGCPNTPIYGKIEIVKQGLTPGGQTAGAPLDGITFDIINRSANAVVVGGKSYATGEVVATAEIHWDGSRWVATSPNLPYGTYDVEENESKPGMANDYYKVNPETHTVEIRENGAIVSVTHKNTITLGEIIVNKVDPLGNPLPGAKFRLEWWDGKEWQLVKDGVQISDADGIVRFAGLDPTLKYRLTEDEAPNGYIPADGSLFEGELPADKLFKVSVKAENAFTPAEIVIYKVNPEGKPLAGAKFCLEWWNGKEWQKVTNADGVKLGGCTSANLKDGFLVSGEDGIVRFEGLAPFEKYRLTEAEAPKGHLPLTEAVFEGKLPENGFVLELTVHNNPTHSLPPTGSVSKTAVITAGSILLAVCGITVFALWRKKKPL